MSNTIFVKNVLPQTTTALFKQQVTISNSNVVEVKKDNEVIKWLNMGRIVQVDAPKQAKKSQGIPSNDPLANLAPLPGTKKTTKKKT